MALRPRRGTKTRATGQVSAQDHGLTSLPVASVAAKARSSRTCASSALADHTAWPMRTAPAIISAAVTGRMILIHRSHTTAALQARVPAGAAPQQPCKPAERVRTQPDGCMRAGRGGGDGDGFPSLLLRVGARAGGVRRAWDDGENERHGANERAADAGGARSA